MLFALLRVLIFAKKITFGNNNNKILDLQLRRLVHDSDAMLQKLDADIVPLVQ